MTEHAHSGHPPAEADRVDTWRVAAVGVGSLVLFLVASVVTVHWMYQRQAVLNPSHPAIPAEAGQRKIGILEQQLFENSNNAQVLRQRQLERLGRYGWVDRDKGLVHVPIEQAMDLVARGERP